MYRILVVDIRYYWGTVGVVTKGRVNEFQVEIGTVSYKIYLGK